MAGLKGKVVLVDFWTYSCINCQRTLPHVEAWYNATPPTGWTWSASTPRSSPSSTSSSNVRTGGSRLGVKYPIAIDNNYGTWNAYENDYWPAEYLIDATGHVRHVDFGEGDYGQTEVLIRQLLVRPIPVHPAPADRRARQDADDSLTPETYLGSTLPSTSPARP